ncbi:hypothetical protein BGZ73_001448 [Actinomortierella ambigua]|nr:hypothetical protein BGZ73_001448 [Actinomortierella ambigua]
MMIAGDDAFNKREFVLLLMYLRTSTVAEDTRKLSVYEDNYRDMIEYIARFLESSSVKKSDRFKDCVDDTCMVPFYIVSLDSNDIRADLGDHKMLHAAYGTRVDNDLLSYGRILKTAFEDPRTIENIRNSLKEDDTVVVRSKEP